MVICDCHSFVTSVSIKDSNIIVDGKTQIFLTYQNENNETIYTDFVESFSEKLYVENISQDGFSTAFVNDKYCNFRVINQRKIDIHISLSLDIKVYDKVSVPCLNSCTYAKFRTIDYKEINIDTALIRKFDFDEEVEIEESNGIKRIVSSSSKINLIDYKAIKDKLFIKLNIENSSVYTNDNEEFEKIYSSFEVSKIFDIANISDNSNCLINTYLGSVTVKAKSNNSLGSIEIYGEIYAEILVISEIETQIISDGYVLGNYSSQKFEKYLVDEKYEDVEYNYKNKYELILSNDIKNIIDISLEILGTSFTSQKVVSSFKTKIVYFDKENNAESSIQTFEIENELNTENDYITLSKINNFDYVILSDNKINLNISFSVVGISKTEKELNVLSNIELEESNNNYPEMTLYFAKKNESLWNIAKKFSSDMEVIKSENKLEKDYLETDRVIVIAGI